LRGANIGLYPKLDSCLYTVSVLQNINSWPSLSFCPETHSQPLQLHSTQCRSLNSQSHQIISSLCRSGDLVISQYIFFSYIETMHTSLPALVVLAGFATLGLGAPAPASAPHPLADVFRRNSQALFCEPNNQGTEICCDQFGGCVPRSQLDPIFEDRIVNQKREPQAIVCDGDACCDQFGGCEFRNRLSEEAAKRIVNKREPQAITCRKNNQGADVCCDQFGGCEFRNRLSPGAEERIVN